MVYFKKLFDTGVLPLKDLEPNIKSAAISWEIILFWYDIIIDSKLSIDLKELRLYGFKNKFKITLLDLLILFISLTMSSGIMFEA